MRFIPLLLIAFLGACTSAQLTTAENDANAALNAVTLACAGAEKAAAQASSVAKGGAAATVANVSSYVTSACSTSAGIIAVAQEPSTVAWLNGLNDSLTAAVATVPAVVAPAS